ncbi:hypothetical protein JGU66_22025 [Myxococcaceae bacterium JPH2]|nr:hypothetical protein [Myxococcaceae bacterium JPH2]
MQHEVSQLRATVHSLQQEVTSLRRENAGTGGSGSSAGSAKASPKTVVASVVMEGQVAAVGRDRLALRDSESGAIYDLRTSQGSPLIQGLPPGSQVRAAYNLTASGDNYLTRVLVLPPQRVAPR